MNNPPALVGLHGCSSSPSSLVWLAGPRLSRSGQLHRQAQLDAEGRLQAEMAAKTELEPLYARFASMSLKTWPPTPGPAIGERLFA